MKTTYRLTASLLNSYRSYLEAEEDWQEYYGDSEEPRISRDDYLAKAENELLDALKHKVSGDSAAADRGTALNEVVDVAIGWKAKKCEVARNMAKINDRMFEFDAELVRTLMERYAGAMPQLRFEFKFFVEPNVSMLLYGYPDYIVGDTIVDLKSTANYSVGKYRDNMQRYVYPLLAERCMAYTPKTFIFDAVQVKQAKGSDNVYGELFPEVYPIDMAECHKVVLDYAKGLISFINLHRNEITPENNNLIIFDV